MLETLKIKNVAIIDSAEISFKKGLNILSGETGAGKSIVIEAISLILGSRANLDLIRAGCDEAVIEGLFSISDAPWICSKLVKYGFPENHMELLIKRTVHRAGRHRIFVNGELATLSILQNICEGLIDLCGQHEHQTLLKTSSQLELLDRYGGLTEKVRKFSSLWFDYQSLRQEVVHLQECETDREKRLDFLKFQIEEMRRADLQEGEEELLQQEKRLLISAESRAQIAVAIRDLLESEDQGVAQSLRTTGQKMRSLEQLDESARCMLDTLERAIAETEEACLQIQKYLHSIELNSERLQIVQDRLALIASLRRKYGKDIPEILATLHRLEQEYCSLGEADQTLAALTQDLSQRENQLKAMSAEISQARMNISQALANSVTYELKDLKMDQALFQVELSQKSDFSTWSATGSDTIQFLVQTNPGELARPLGKIASGGELSRLMLAVRRVISDKGNIGVYLFDEIDTGMGGQTAFQVGKKLKSVSLYNQVICITHLPQVASFADHHLVVQKSTLGTRTVTEITQLQESERKSELARMLGGPLLTQKSLENATELLALAQETVPREQRP